MVYVRGGIRNLERVFSLTDPLSVLIYVLAKTKQTVHEKPKLINK